jgi:outer membrane protein
MAMMSMGSAGDPKAIRRQEERSMKRGPWRWLAVAVLVGGGAATLPSPGLAAEAVIKVSLREAIQMALAVSPEVRERLQGVEAARGKLDQAASAYYPQAEILGIIGPSQRARADNDCVPTGVAGLPAGGLSCTGIRTSDKKGSSPINGIFGLSSIQVVQPVYTFGKLSGFKEAATKGVAVEEGKVAEKRADIIFKVRELYYGLLFAMDTKGLLADMKEQVEKAQEKVEKSLEAESPSADQVDLYKLRTFVGQLAKGLHEAEKGEELSREALATYLGLAPGQRVELDADGLEAEVRQVPRVEAQVSDALRLRPELAQVRAGVDATRALVEAERSNYFPQFFVALVGAWSGATNRSYIENPFVNDTFSQRGAGLIGGFKLNVDFGITGGKVRTAQAEHMKIVETKNFAEKFIPLQVRKARIELEEARKSIEATRDGYLNARKWLVAAVANFDLGIGEAKDVADAIGGFVQLRVDNLRSVYNYNLALANLDRATGRDLEP